MATIKKWLNENGFNWETGRIIYHETDDSSPGWGDAKSAEEVPADHPILIKEFYDGHGGPECPRFVAEDSQAIYFPSQYDGSTGCEKVWKNLDRYLDPKTETPYPGG